MFKEYLIKAMATLSLLTTISAWAGDVGSDSSNNDGAGTSQPTKSQPIANSGADQTVEENTLVTLSGIGTNSDRSIKSYSWTQTAGKPVRLINADSATASFTSPEVTKDETLTFQLITTDDAGRVSEESVDVKVNHFFDKNVILRVVRVTEDWVPYASADGWTDAVKSGFKESETVKYYEAAIWEENASINFYAFDNNFYAFYGLAPGENVTDEQKLAYRESYRLLKFDGLPPESDYLARSEFIRDSFIEIAQYMVNQHPNADHHLFYSGHEGPGGRLFGAQLHAHDASSFLQSWVLSLGHNLGVIDMGEPCNKGSLADLKNFCQYADYYIASDLTNGGYDFDDWTIEKYDETDVVLQYHQLFANSFNLKDVLIKRINLMQKAYEYSVGYMTENKVQQANYLYSCSSYKSFYEAFSEFTYGKPEYSIDDDLLHYLKSNNASKDLIGKFNDIISHSANNRDFFEWEVESNGLLMEDQY